MDRDMHYSDYRSGEVVNGIKRTTQRALYYATGFTEEDFHKPVVGIVHSYNELIPGHLFLGELAKHAALGVADAGGMPREFSTIGLCDGICAGHAGRRYPLASREVIADSIEMMVEANHLDAIVMIAACDKIVPGMLMAAARLDIPAVLVSGGYMLAGNYKEYTNLGISQLHKIEHKALDGEISVDELREIEKRAIPGAGSCPILGTANTLATVAEAMGIALPDNGSTAAVSGRRRAIAREAGRQAVALLKAGITSRKILTREALINGIVACMGIGSSTNAMLHLLAIAKEAGVELTLDDFDELSRKTPYLCNILNSGTHTLADFEAAGGTPALLKEMESLLDTTQITVTGKTLGENLANVQTFPNDVIFPLDKPRSTNGGLAILYGNLAPEGASLKYGAVKEENMCFTGPAHVFVSMDEVNVAVKNNELKDGEVIVIRYEGPKGGPGMRETHLITSQYVHSGWGNRCALVSDGRIMGSTQTPCVGMVAPEAAADGPIAAIQDGDIITIDIPNRKLSVDLSDEEIARRLAEVQHVVKPRTPSLAHYAALVGSASEGAVLKKD